ncbi:hypothetical protein V8C35DRAFT_293539 [Trichoderma chlorosporum]
MLTARLTALPYVLPCSSLLFPALHRLLPASMDMVLVRKTRDLHACPQQVPSPNQSQVNATNACVAKCPQGNGSAAETKVYAQCVQNCIQENYYATSEGTPSQTGGSGDHAANTGTDTAAAPTGSSGSSTDGSSGSASGSATGTKSGSATGTKTGAAATSSTHNAAPAIIASGGALAGVIAALLAL